MARITAELADQYLQWIAETGIDQFGARQARIYLA
jgi:hypothetical protein